MKYQRLSVILIVAMIFGSGLSIHLSAQDYVQQEVNRLYKEGMAAYKAKNYKIFMESFRELHKLRPTSRLILFNLSGGYALNKMPQKAIQHLRELIKFDANPQILKDQDFDSLRENPEFKDIVKQLKEMYNPKVVSKEVFRIKEKDLHAEAIAYDSKTGRFFISSVHKRKIIVRDKDGTFKEFTKQGQDGLDSVLGLRTDVKKRVLWVTSTAFPQMIGYGQLDRGRSGVFKYHMDTGKLIKKYIIHDENPHNFDDIVIHPKTGDAFVSDNKNIYIIRKSKDRLRRFLKNSPIFSAQGLDFCDNGKKLVIADWSYGLYLVDIQKKEIITKIAPPVNGTLLGIDGLYRVPDTKWWVAIQNGTNPMRIVRFMLSKDFTRVEKYEVLERANPIFGDPTLGTLEDKNFYFVANSQWKSYTRQGNIFPMEKLKEIIILKIKL